jgi:hypothetical protein
VESQRYSSSPLSSSNAHNLTHRLSVGATSDRRYALRIHIHRHLEVGVTERLLDRLHVLSVCLHQRAQAVPQRVPADRFLDLQDVL